MQHYVAFLEQLSTLWQLLWFWKDPRSKNIWLPPYCLSCVCLIWHTVWFPCPLLHTDFLSDLTGLIQLEHFANFFQLVSIKYPRMIKCVNRQKEFCRKPKDDFDTYRWNLCPSCKVGNLLLFSDSAPIDKFYFTPIDMLCYW